MSSADRALPPLRDNQALASAPDAHVWLSASAGTGKTQVLAARVFRLLLRGVDPGAILCLTFTKAGAAEMSQRISQRLAAWVRMPDEGLGADLIALGERPTPALRQRARTLFAKVLDAPGGGVRIQTIHGFCQSLLAAFPIEAGLVPGFRPIEAREEGSLAREALAEMLVDADREGRARPVDAVGRLSVRLGEMGAEAFLMACARAPDAMAALPLGEGIRPFLRRALDLPSGDIEAAITAACGCDFDADDLRRIARANRSWGAATGIGHAEIVEAWLSAEHGDRASTLEQLRGVAFTAKGDPRKVSPKLIDAEPAYADLALALGTRCAELVALRARAGYADLLADAIDVGRDYAAAYARAKRRVGAVDFDDLIRATIGLLDQPGMGEWVRYKLDQSTEHILVDEAQDTNPEQWRIVGAMAREFFAGLGAHGERFRTLFTVGDFKQAIYGFQGTDPIYFRAAEELFERLAREAWEAEDEARGRGAPVLARPMSRLSLTQSFRSTAPVLAFVDAALAAIPTPGMGALAEPEPHASEVPGAGSVTLWPPELGEAEDGEDEEGWIGDATRALASKIAKAVRGWLDERRLKRDGTPLQPQDVMILVKRRGELASLIVARLYAEGVPVAGVDRLRLNAPLAVQDLLAAIRFVLQPDDDLSLASLLVSPLLGWSQEQLMAAAPRASGSLWRQLQREQDGIALVPLREMLRRADIATPYQFLEEILSGGLNGRRKLLARLGQEARDPIEELLGAALQFEAAGTPSLQRFLDWFDRGEVEIKRDPSAPLDAVRVMTAHGAKGLQAPLVILADATVDPASAPRRGLAWQPEGFDHALPILYPKADERGPALAELVAQTQQRELEEHWRLFYVAATRAEEQLVIAGALGPRAKGVPPAASWYAVAERALIALGADETAEGKVHREGPTANPRTVAPATPAAGGAVPDWARRTAPVEARPPRPLAPSSLGEDMVADPPPSPAMRTAAERGRLIHALFERLPEVAATERQAAAKRWLAREAAALPLSERDTISATVCDILGDPRFADLFGPDSLAEAPIAAVVEGGLVVAGTADRLLVTADRIAVIDFKTGRRVPAAQDALPVQHVRQMAAYRAALAVIFPGRRIDAALLYTSGPALFALPDALLDAHKPSFSSVQQSFDLPG